MKTITISVDDETYRRRCARAEAAGQPVAEMVGRWLTDWTGKPAVPDAEQERAPQELYDILAGIAARQQADGAVFRVADNLPREQLYDRDALR